MKKRWFRQYRFYALFATGTLLAYVLVSLWWYRSGMEWLISIHPRLSSPTPPPRSSQSSWEGSKNKAIDFALVNGHRVFLDFDWLHFKWFGPFRKRFDPQGNPYFEKGFAQGFWYLPGLLRAAEEPSLFQVERPVANTTVRISIWPERGSPFVVRLESRPKEQSGNISGIFFQRYGGKIENRSTAVLDWASLSRMIEICEDPDFWRPLSDEEKRLHLDPHRSIWVFEFSDSSTYRAFISNVSNSGTPKRTKPDLPDPFLPEFLNPESPRDLSKQREVLEILTQPFLDEKGNFPTTSGWLPY